MSPNLTAGYPGVTVLQEEAIWKGAGNLAFSPTVDIITNVAKLPPQFSLAIIIANIY